MNYTLKDYFKKTSVYSAAIISIYPPFTFFSVFFPDKAIKYLNYFRENIIIDFSC